MRLGKATLDLSCSYATAAKRPCYFCGDTGGYVVDFSYLRGPDGKRSDKRINDAVTVCAACFDDENPVSSCLYPWK